MKIKDITLFLSKVEKNYKDIVNENAFLRKFIDDTLKTEKDFNECREIWKELQKKLHKNNKDTESRHLNI